MTELEVSFKAWDTVTAGPDLDAILNVHNNSSYPDKAVTRGLRTFLGIYTLGYTHQEAGLIAICSDMAEGKRMVRIHSKEGGNIWLITPRKDATGEELQRYRFSNASHNYITFESEETNYTVELR